MGFNNGKMVLGMRVREKIIKLKEKEPFFMLMVICMLANEKTIK